MDKFEALLAKSKANTPATTVAEPINTFDAVLAKRTSLPAVEPRALSLGDRLLVSISQLAPVQAVLRSDPRQAALDIGGGLTRAGAGLYDIGKLGIETIGYPVSQPIEYLKGIPTEERSFQKALTFPTYSAVEEGLKEIAEPRGLEPKSLPSRLIEYGTAGVPGLIGGLTMEGGAKIGEVVGGETGKAIGGAIGTIAGVFAPGASKNVMKKGAKLFESLDTRAQKQVLDLMTPDEIEKLKLAQEAGTITSTVNVPKTLAEVTESPYLAGIQAELATAKKASPITAGREARTEALTTAAKEIGTPPTKGEFEYLVNDIVQKQVAQKEIAQGNLLKTIEKPTALDIEKRGLELRKSLSSRAETIKDKVVDPAWALVGSDAAVDISKGQDAIEKYVVREIAKERYENYPSALTKYISRIQNLGDDTSWKQLDEVRRVGQKTAQQIAGDRDALRVFNDINSEFLNSAKEYAKKIGSPEYANMENAIAASRNYYKTFTEGVTGVALAQKYGNYKTSASKLVNKFLAEPETVKEIGTKFGKNSDEMIVLRQTLLEKLEGKKASEVVGYLNDPKIIPLYKAAFKDDLQKVQQYAKQKAKKLPIEQWMINSTSEAALPNKIFQNERSVEKFINDFAGTEIVDIAKNKFISQMMIKGDITSRADYYRKIGQKLFNKDWDTTQKLLADLESSKLPQLLLQRAATAGSPTQPRQKLAEVLKTKVGLQKVAERMPTLGAWLGGAIGVKVGGVHGAFTGGMAGGAVGQAAKARITNRAERLQSAMAQLFADPRLIDLAKKPATKENIKALDSILQQLVVGRGVAMSMRQEEGE